MKSAPGFQFPVAAASRTGSWQGAGGAGQAQSCPAGSSYISCFLTTDRLNAKQVVAAKCGRLSLIYEKDLFGPFPVQKPVFLSLLLSYFTGTHCDVQGTWAHFYTRFVFLFFLFKSKKCTACHSWIHG